MAPRFFDARSDASWLAVDDARSDASWDYVATQADGCSEASWDVLSHAAATPCHTPRCVSIKPVLAFRLPGGTVCEEQPSLSSLLDLIRLCSWERALRCLRTAPHPEALASERDSDGDSALSWAVYKAKGGNTSCLMLICDLLHLAPSMAKSRDKCKFLPLHAAAWGCARPEVATLLSAAFPAAIYDKGPGMTPYEMGEYYHRSSLRRTSSRNVFSWFAPKDMLRSAAEIADGAGGGWPSALAGLQLPPAHELRSMSAADIQQAFDLPCRLAALLSGFVCDSASAPAARLCAITECGSTLFDQCTSVKQPEPLAMPLKLKLQAREPTRPRRAPRQRRRWPCRRYVDEGADSDLDGAPMSRAAAEGVDVVRELKAKDEGRYAGLSRVRNTRCACRQQSIVQDGAGGLHRLEFHAAFKMSRSAQRAAGEPKWQPKKRWQKERAMDRAAKAEHLNLYLI